MTVKVDVTQERTSQETTYDVRTTVTFVSGITDHIFVFNAETEVFSHVAVPYDIYNYPESKLEADNAGLHYFRKTEVIQSFDALDVAQAAAEYTIERVSYLTQQYGSATNQFVGTSNFSFSEN
jgi:hypothetical protein